VLLTVTYLLVAHQYRGSFFVNAGRSAGVVIAERAPPGTGGLGVNPDGSVGTIFPKGVKIPSAAQLQAQGRAQSNAALRQLLVQSGIALALMTVLSIWLGWLVAGRVLRPLRTITNAAREISVSNLHRRLSLEGPDDELRQLGSTFDQLLARLEASFGAQRRFVANASHELRTPLTLERALVEVALADPNATVESLREMGQQVLVAGERQERLIEALLTLSRSQRGVDRHEPVDLAAAAAEAVDTVGVDGLTVQTRLAPARTVGDPRLVERLVANLVGNAVHHNVAGGRVSVETGMRNGHALLTVANTGPVIPPADLDRLFQPFQRLEHERTGDTNGVGLGLSIAQAIATAHGASIEARAQRGGGLRVEVRFAALTGLPQAAPLLSSGR
jgi:signal transduction histidine kinase